MTLRDFSANPAGVEVDQASPPHGAGFQDSREYERALHQRPRVASVDEIIRAGVSSHGFSEIQTVTLLENERRCHGICEKHLDRIRYFLLRNQIQVAQGSGRQLLGHSEW